MFIVRGPNLAKAHRRTWHTGVGDTQAQRHTHTSTQPALPYCMFVAHWFVMR